MGEKGRLDNDEIDRLVREAEQYKAEDDQIKKKIEAKNSLEHYCYTIKQQLDDAKLKAQFTEDDKKPSMTLPTKLSNGSRETPTPNSKSTKPNKKKPRLSGTPSCKEFTKKWVVNPEECPVVCQEGCLEVECPEVCLVEWECQVGWEEECLSNHLRLPMLMKLTDPAEINIKFLKISIFLSVYMYLTNIA